ncbi:diaminopimelate decarboxylase [Chloroflexota bacterium]
MTGEHKLASYPLFPLTADVDEKGHLTLGGCDSLALAGEYGTPLYVFDEADLRARCAEFKREFGGRYPDTAVLYASKAFTSRALLRIIKEEGLGLDVVSGGEMSIARAVDFPMETVYFHGNNKSAAELRQALDSGVGRIVVDNFQEMEMLDALAGGQGCKADVLLRLTPGIDPHTHAYNSTGVIDSKFGFTLSDWPRAVAVARAAANLNLIGLHCHLGSGLHETEPYRKAIEVILDFAALMQREHGFTMKEFDIGGGYGVAYTMEEKPLPVSQFAEVITGLVKEKCNKLGPDLPRLLVEPGRSIVARAAVALYTVGVVKEIPGVRCYIAVDGGMGDNIRHALYQARHEAVLANKALEKAAGKVTVAGKFCESGDILIRDINLPEVAAGDILAVADCGAYCLPLASNYNANPRPAVVMVKDGQSRLIRRRETSEDLMRCDVA